MCVWCVCVLCVCVCVRACVPMLCMCMCVFMLACLRSTDKCLGCTYRGTAGPSVVCVVVGILPLFDALLVKKNKSEANHKEDICSLKKVRYSGSEAAPELSTTTCPRT